MATQWTEVLFERFAEPLIEFGNLPGIAHVDDVHRLFAPAVLTSQAMIAGQPVMQVLAPGDEAAFAADRQRVREWLDTLARPKHSARARAQVQRDVEALMGRTVELHGTARFADGVLSLSVTPVVTGVEGVIAFGMAMLADDSAKRWKRLGRCKLKGCGEFFLRSPGDWRQEYCRIAHRQKANDMKRPARRRSES